MRTFSGKTLVRSDPPLHSRAGRARHAPGPAPWNRPCPGRRMAAEWWADPRQARIHHGLGEVGVLAEEAIAGVHRIGPGGAGGGEQLVGAQISVGTGRTAQGNGLGGFAHMEGVGIGVGVDRNGVDAHAVSGLDHPAGDFAAIGDEDLS